MCRFLTACALFALFNLSILAGQNWLSERENETERGETCQSRSNSSNAAVKLLDAVRESNIFQPMYGSWPWWIAHQFVAEDKAPDVALLGSSQMNSVAWTTVANMLDQNLDCVVHRRVDTLEDRLSKRLGIQDVSVFNCAISGAMASDNYYIASALLSGERKPKVVIIGISPRDFIDNLVQSVNSTDAFRFFSVFVDDEEAARLAYPSIVERICAMIAKKVDGMSMRSLHKFANQIIHPEHDTEGGVTHSAVKAAIMGDGREILTPGVFRIPPRFPDAYWDNSSEYARRYRNPRAPILSYQTRFFEKFLSEMRQKEIDVVVIGMPLMPQNYSLLSPAFWLQFESGVAGLCKKYDATFVNYCKAEGFTQSDFVDTVHVNTRGGYKLVELFADALCANKRLASRLRNEDCSIASSSTAPD